MTSPGCPAIVGSMFHLSEPDEFVPHSHSLVSQLCPSTAREQAAAAERVFGPIQAKPNPTT